MDGSRTVCGLKSQFSHLLLFIKQSAQRAYFAPCAVVGTVRLSVNRQAFLPSWGSQGKCDENSIHEGIGGGTPVSLGHFPCL